VNLLSTGDFEVDAHGGVARRDILVHMHPDVFAGLEILGLAGDVCGAGCGVEVSGVGGSGIGGEGAVGGVVAAVITTEAVVCYREGDVVAEGVGL